MLVQVAKGRFLPAAEGVIGQRHRDRHVHTHHPDIDPVGKVAGGVAVAGKDRGAVAVFVVHRIAKSLFVGLGADGGQDGAEDLGLVDVHVGGHVVEQVRADKETVLVALQAEVTAIDDQFRPLVHTGFHQPQDVFLGRLGDNGAVIHVVAGGVGADLQFLDPRDQLFDQAVGGFVAHRHGDRDCHAAFARSPIARTDQRVGGLVHVGIRHDDHVVLGPAKALHALAGRAATGIDVFRDRSGADEAHRLDHLVVEDRIDRFLVTVHHLQDALGQAGLFHQLRQHQRDRGVTLRRFQDKGVAAGDGGGEHPHRDHGGEVERCDARGDAKRLAHRIDVDAGAGAVGVFALQHLRRADAVFDDFQPALHVALGIGEGLAMLAAQRLGQLVHVAVQQAHEGHQHAGAALRVHGGPGGLCGGGHFDGLVQLLFRGQRHLGLNLAGGRVHDIGKAAGRAFDMFAADIMGHFLHGILHRLRGG